MYNIKIKPVTQEDIPIWIALSHEYDDYVRELVSDLTEWYEGNESDLAFTDYMNAKIQKHEAFMATDNNKKKCLGIIAFSRTYNRITFFGISHSQDYNLVGEILMSYALNQLNTKLEITINIIKSTSQYIERERKLIEKYGFIYISSELENGVPVDKMMKQPS